MPRAFVTGGSGFLGRNLLTHLDRSGWDVAALARSTDSDGVVTEHGARPIRGDLPAMPPSSAELRGTDVVFHLAARIAEWGDERRTFEVNLEGTRRMLAVARSAGVGRFVHVSTEAVLVSGRQLRDVDESWPVPARPLGAYAASKAEAERLVREANSQDMTTVVVRPRLLWGAGDTSLLPLFVAAARGGRLVWIGGGRYLTSTCHARNACDVLLRAATVGRSGGVYFVTDGAPVEFRGFVESMLRTQDIEPPTRQIPRTVAHAMAIVGEGAWRLLPLPGRPPLTHATFHTMGERLTVRDDLARRELGYVGVVTREDGLREMRPVATPSA